MSSLIYPNLTSIVPGCVIGDNVVFSSGLMQGLPYYLGPPRCAIELDIQKACEMLNCKFLFSVMELMGLPVLLLAQVQKCITSTMFSTKINGTLERSLAGKSGLCQGDPYAPPPPTPPITPWQFTIKMEAFTAFLHRITSDLGFHVHWKPEITKTTSLIFSDDVTVFARGDENSIMMLLNEVNQLSAVSGLQPK